MDLVEKEGDRDKLKEAGKLLDAAGAGGRHDAALYAARGRLKSLG